MKLNIGPAFVPLSPLPASRKRRRPYTTCVLQTPPNSEPPPALIPINPDQSCGFAALLGPSNSGKSTLLNRILGQKVSIVTPKVQTTRCRVAGIATISDTQVIFLDTPGIFEAHNRLARAMVKTAWTSGKQADAVAVVIDAALMFHEGRRVRSGRLYVPDDVQEVLNGVVRRRQRGHTADVCVCANKIDAVPDEERGFVQERMEVIMESFGLNGIGADLFMMSARKGDKVDEFVKWVTERMPKGQWLYPEDDLTDMPSRLLAAEVTREKAFLVLKQELPYEIAVETSSYEERKDGSVRIFQDILVARQSQRMIVLGKGGAVVKKIGMKARLELQEILGTTVHLMLTVKVKSKWKEDRKQYEQWGLDFHA